MICKYKQQEVIKPAQLRVPDPYENKIPDRSKLVIGGAIAILLGCLIFVAFNIRGCN